MKLIEELEELIEEEISDSKKYAKMAIKLKTEHPGLAQTLYSISTQEEAHKNMLHNEVVKLIEAYRTQHGAPPAEMLAVYDYIHKKHIEKAAEAKRYQEMYKTT